MYAGVFGVIFALWLATPVFIRPKAYSVPSVKVTTYVAGKNIYRLLFVGDSRTYTDIQPRVVDPIVSRNSYNLASFGLWIPVQYLEFRDVFKEVPPDSVIVWSLSHRNFVPIGDRWWIPGQYPFGLDDLAEYVRDGYPLKRAIQEYEEAPYSSVDAVVKGRKKLLASLQQVVWQRPAPPTPPPAATIRSPDLDRGYDVESSRADLTQAEINSAAAARIMETLKQDSRVTGVSPLAVDGIIRSIESTRSDGGYERIIVDHDFFREQQSKLWPRRTDVVGVCQFDANQVYMKTFTKILDLVSKYRLRMIVNYIEDAPGSWQSDLDRHCAKQFMIDKIAPILKQRGIAFINPDLYPIIQFSNEFYFDNSHLTTEGGAIYSRLLAGQINTVLKDRGW